MLLVALLWKKRQKGKKRRKQGLVFITLKSLYDETGGRCRSTALKAETWQIHRRQRWNAKQGNLVASLRFQPWNLDRPSNRGVGDQITLQLPLRKKRQVVRGPEVAAPINHRRRPVRRGYYELQTMTAVKETSIDAAIVAVLEFHVKTAFSPRSTYFRFTPDWIWQESSKTPQYTAAHHREVSCG